MSRTIMVVDDEKNTREGLKWALEATGAEIFLAENGEQALIKLGNIHVDLVISDLKMPKMDGMELLDHILDEFTETDFVMLTGHGTVETAVEAMKRGAFDYLMKPVNIDELQLLVDRAFEQKSLKQENERLRREVNDRYGFESIVGHSPQMENIFEKIRQVSPTKANVLVQGETGTGKELIAKAIHFTSNRARKPFIAVNCGALTQTLLESELFGHEKGAFTGAIRQKPGRFELANTGTIFLDEIGETTPELQVRLLRVLQEHEFERVGGTKLVKVDVRVIAATNRNLKKEVEAGRFREDLYYRLNVIRIDIPSLRERLDDIPLIASHFLREFNREHGKSLSLSPKSVSYLQNYHWPGNVRQLRTVIESSVILTSGKEIAPKNLPDEIRTESAPSNMVRLRVGMTVADAERELIKATLSEFSGNKAKAARTLGLGRKTLYRKLQEYEIELSED
jgi:DNA-binding NtrC family response regulator